MYRDNDLDVPSELLELDVRSERIWMHRNNFCDLSTIVVELNNSTLPWKSTSEAVFYGPQTFLKADFSLNYRKHDLL
jgi:hypothetical protein